MVTDPAGLFEILSSAKVLRLGLVDRGRAYIVPLNFGYDASPSSPPETWRLFVHCASSGRKIDLLRRTPIVSFELDTHHSLRSGDSACDYSYSYSCIMGEAVARFLTSLDDKRDAFSLLMDHQAHPGNWTFDDALLSRTTALALRVTSISGKRNIQT
ncbi:MAG: pyridoxamine 5'-phosphate oxidase family protein [Oscillospiraceae bacterium]|nr:pyridoxamine 5'-phosphate oxidase family protein [Oscillospiraceae bacterium]